MFCICKNDVENSFLLRFSAKKMLQPSEEPTHIVNQTVGEGGMVSELIILFYF